KAPYTGSYEFKVYADDGVKMIVNDREILSRWAIDGGEQESKATLNLEEGKIYKFEAQHGNFSKKGARFRLYAPDAFNYKTWYWPASVDTFVAIPGKLFKEKRENDFRRKNHISQIDVL